MNCKKCGVVIKEGNELCEDCITGESRKKESYLDDLLQSVDMEPVQTRLDDLAKRTKKQKVMREDIDLNQGEEELGITVKENDNPLKERMEEPKENIIDGAGFEENMVESEASEENMAESDTSEENEKIAVGELSEENRMEEKGMMDQADGSEIEVLEDLDSEDIGDLLSEMENLSEESEEFEEERPEDALEELELTEGEPEDVVEELELSEGEPEDVVEELELSEGEPEDVEEELATTDELMDMDAIGQSVDGLDKIESEGEGNSEDILSLMDNEGEAQPEGEIPEDNSEGEENLDDILSAMGAEEEGKPEGDTIKDNPEEEEGLDDILSVMGEEEEGKPEGDTIKDNPEEEEGLDDILSVMGEEEEGKPEGDTTEDKPEGEVAKAETNGGEESPELMDNVDESDEDLEDLGEIDDLFKKFEEEGLLEEGNAIGEEASEGDVNILEQLANQEESNVTNGENVGNNEISGMEDVFADTLSVMSYDSGGDMDAEGEILAIKEDKPPSKPNLFKRLFGNVVDEKEIKKVAEEKKKKLEKEILQQEKKDKQKVDKEEKAKQKEIDKEEKEKKKQEEKQKKIEEKQEKKRLKQEKKELDALSEENEVEGRINKAGATIIFMLLAAIVVWIVIGTLSYSYNHSIELSNEYFGMGKYQEAYNELNGLKLREKDKRLYQQVRLIQYVQREKQSSSNFRELKMYPESVNSLLRGLKKYQEYLSYASELGVGDILDEVKQELVMELNENYHISEEMAWEINAIEDETEYTNRILQVIQQSNPS